MEPENVHFSPAFTVALGVKPLTPGLDVTLPSGVLAMFPGLRGPGESPASLVKPDFVLNKKALETRGSFDLLYP